MVVSSTAEEEARFPEAAHSNYEKVSTVVDILEIVSWENQLKNSVSHTPIFVTYLNLK